MRSENDKKGVLYTVLAIICAFVGLFSGVLIDRVHQAFLLLSVVSMIGVALFIRFAILIEMKKLEDEDGGRRDEEYF